HPIRTFCFSLSSPPPSPPLFPYTTLFRSVASPESANNSGSQTAFIPMLTLGLPPNAVLALMVGAMIIHNIQPGPQVMTSNPELLDRKSTRLNSSHVKISYAVFCLKKKKNL